MPHPTLPVPRCRPDRRPTLSSIESEYASIPSFARLARPSCTRATSLPALPRTSEPAADGPPHAAELPSAEAPAARRVQGAAGGGLAAVGVDAERQPQASLLLGQSATTLGSLSGSVSAPPAEQRTPEQSARPTPAAGMLATPYDASPGPTPGVGGREDVLRARTSHEARSAAPVTRPTSVATRFGPRAQTSMGDTARRPAAFDAATARLAAVAASGEAPLCSTPYSGPSPHRSSSTPTLMSSWQDRARAQLEEHAQASPSP